VKREKVSLLGEKVRVGVRRLGIGQKQRKENGGKRRGSGKEGPNLEGGGRIMISQKIRERSQIKVICNREKGGETDEEKEETES